MEKIQQALAKARATREAVSPQAGPATPARAVEPATQAAQASAKVQAWEALQPLHPDMIRLQKGRVVTITNAREAIAFDAMRTKVLQQMRANNWRRLAITSPAAACGKSTVALNLAFSMARQPEIHTIVAELDLRRPSLAQMLGVKPEKSLAQVLDGQADFADHTYRYGNNIAFALNAGPARNPSELLQSARVSDRLAEIEAKYEPDLMIFDMPPMLVTDDTMAFVGKVDCVLLVAAAEASTVKEIDNCERELASQTNVMGVILNKCRHMGPDYGYDYYG